MENTEFQKMKPDWVNSLTLKAVVITIMVLTLLIPLGMIKSVIIERENNNRQVDNEMIQQWGDLQQVIGPVLHIPVISNHYVRNELKQEKKWIHFMPENLDINGNIIPETRKRGIYKSTVYNSEILFKGTFKPDFKVLEKYDEVLYNEANLSLSINDNRGIKGKIMALWNSKPLSFEPGLKCTDLADNGINTNLNSLLNSNQDQEYNFDIKINLSGTKQITFCPIGKSTSAKLESTWPDPSFMGSFLPIKREVGKNGFIAQYEVTHLNRSFPQNWEGKTYKLNNSSFGVNLYIPNNHYQKSLRSAKYGILFIILTTLVLLFIEISQKKEIHILQYILVSLALVLFFSVLTALSEHLGFNWAYITASIATISLIISYSKALLKSNKLVLWVGGLLTALYSFIFVLLQLEDYAFLAGNIGLFIILAVIMRVTSKLKIKSTEI